MNYLKLISKQSFAFLATLGFLIFSVSCGEDESKVTLPELTADFSASATTVTAGDEVTFTSSTTGDADGYAWTFEGGTPATSTDVNPKVIYAEPGIYKVSLVVSRSADEMSVTIDKGDFITAEEPLAVTASFTSDAQAIEQGQTITFTNTSTSNGTGATAEWSFEGGSPATSTENEVTVTYTEAGDFNVTLKATEGEVADIFERNDFISVSAISASFSASALSVEAGNTITFTNTSTTGATPAWTFEGGSPETSTDNEVTVTYANAGQYDVTLVASKNGIDITTLETDYVDITAPSNAVFMSTKLASDGLSIAVTYDKSLNDPSGEAAAFDIKVDEVSVGISSVSLDANDDKTMVVIIGTAITAGQSIVLSYTPGSLTATDGVVLEAITDHTVVNTISDGQPTGNLIVNYDMDFESVVIENVFTEMGGQVPEGATREISIEQAFSGSQSLHVKIPAGGNATMTTLPTASAFALDASKTYTMSFNLYTITQGAEFTVRIQPLAGWAENKIWTGACCGMDVGQWSTREWEVSGADIAEGKFHFQFISTAESESEYFLDNFTIEEK